MEGGAYCDEGEDAHGRERGDRNQALRLSACVHPAGEGCQAGSRKVGILV